MGRLIDITKDGMMLESQEPIEIKKGYRLCVELPNSLVRNPKISFDAKSIWCRKEGDFRNIQGGIPTAKSGYKGWEKSQWIDGEIQT